MPRRPGFASFCIATLKQLAPTATAVCLALASFLPGSVKHLIHSRGVLHNEYHLVAFAFFATLLSRSSRSHAQRLRLAGWAVFLGCTIELAQAARNYADVETLDVLCDTVGVALGLLLPYAAKAWSRRSTLLRPSLGQPDQILPRLIS